MERPIKPKAKDSVLDTCNHCGEHGRHLLIDKEWFGEDIDQWECENCASHYPDKPEC